MGTTKENVLHIFPFSLQFFSVNQETFTTRAGVRFLLKILCIISIDHFTNSSLMMSETQKYLDFRIHNILIAFGNFACPH